MTTIHKNRTRLLWLLSVLLLLVILLAFLQQILIPHTPERSLTIEYYSAETEHNLLFVGDCEVYENFSTVTLWEKYGISSYIRGSPQQLIWQSYYLLADAIAHGEAPEAVVFNVLAMKYDEPQKEEYNRVTLDGMEWSSLKLEAIRASMTEKEDFLSYIFPLLRYHDRIDELTVDDFASLFREPEAVSYNGYMMQTKIEAPENKDIQISPYPEELLSDYCFDYLDRMRLLCEENGIQLILIKAPTNHWEYHWYDAWNDQIVAYAEEHGLSYYNFIGMEDEIGIDWSTDTFDKGIHLNVYGAEKMSLYFGKILSEELGISDLRSDQELSETWDAIIERYENQKAGNQ